MSREELARAIVGPARRAGLTVEPELLETLLRDVEDQPGALPLLSTALLAVHTLVPPKYFQLPGQLFPSWPEWHLEWAIGLFSATALLLLMPKILSVVLVCAKGARRYGGGLRLAGSMAAELFFSALLAPIRNPYALDRNHSGSCSGSCS